MIIAAISLLGAAIVLAMQAPFLGATDTSCSWPLLHVIRGYGGDHICGNASASRLWGSFGVMSVWLVVVIATIVGARCRSRTGRRA